MKKITGNGVFVLIQNQQEDIEFRELVGKEGFKWSDHVSLLSTSRWSISTSYMMYFLTPSKYVFCDEYCDPFKKPFTSNYLTLKQFKNKYSMEEKTIKLTLEEARKLYKNGQKDIKHLLLTTFSKEELEKEEFPKTWEECLNKYSELYYISDIMCCILKTNKMNNPLYTFQNCLPSEEIAKQMLALYKLLVCRDVWRNGWVPKSGECMGVIYRISKGLTVDITYYDRFILTFPTEKCATEFFDAFRELIIQAGDLI